MSLLRPVLSFTFALSLVACTESEPGPEATPAELYRAAVEDAADPEADEIVDDLVAITPDNPDLMFDDQGRVLMVTWTSWSGYDGMDGASMPLGVEVWVTPIPSLKEFCTATGLQGADLSARLEQLMGLPADNGKDRLVTMWVPLDGMFRPSPDPEIDDSVAQLDFRADVDPAHKTWIEDLRAASYGDDPGYPWTQLGYTYDWDADADSEVGLSEFVIRAGTEIVIDGVVHQNDYCKQ
ncbi:hypothetical protein [Nannocystis bainbridge]|uniref:Lipoprotein n=1 Tax=Nannocystis bainbridge TaxID=2995303 RepID=A0ABT5E0P4_9BACT|nr:hypothetical protein [Nannocystis bainbridge]MDC0719444.1 hypothetical protein [Nannocystis bainbridge]